MLSDIITENGLDLGIATPGNDFIIVSQLPPEQIAHFSASPFQNAIALLEGNDYLVNDNNGKIIYGNQGSDTIIGGGGSDTLFGGKDNDLLEATGGNNILFGNLGNDTLIGGPGNDSLYGGVGNDVVIGGPGNSIISGDKGLDTLTGGGGANEFLLQSSSANRDVITDFQPGTDKLRAPSGLTTLEIQASGSSVLVLNNRGETLATLNNLQPSDISINDFIGITELVGGGNGGDPNSSFEQEVLELVNQERSQFGLVSLEFEPLLAEAARTHSTNMALQDFFSHTGADGSQFTDRIRNTGFSITGMSAENIGVGYTTPQQVVEGWMNSPGHRDNILNPNFTQLGVGHYFLENDTGNENWNHYWTQKFHAGTPQIEIPWPVDNEPLPPEPPLPPEQGVDIYAPSSLDGFESEELELYNLINEYRMENNLDPIPASRALTTVANRRVLDLAKNVGEVTHAGSDFIYDANDSSTWSNMWDAPARFNTGYRDIGYENVIGYSGFDGPTITAEEALTGWKNSPPHNAVILNQEEWANMEWNALGVGLYNGYGTLWFGEEVDPTGVPSGYQ